MCRGEKEKKNEKKREEKGNIKERKKKGCQECQ
jgi:hypothetical protein